MDVAKLSAKTRPFLADKGGHLNTVHWLRLYVHIRYRLETWSLEIK